MQVLGDLVKLPADSDSLPLPWWHRAPLGLLNGTTVFVGLTEKGPRPVGEVVISVLNPNNWDKMYHVACSPKDASGILERKFGLVSPSNIALAEAVTINRGADYHHDVELVCEPYQGVDGQRDLESTRKRFIDAGFADTTIEAYHAFPSAIVEHKVRVVDHGWVRGTRWKKLVTKYSSPTDLEQVDLTRAVVSADTGRRILRFVFPRKGARSIKIVHADIPGALQALTGALVASQANILSALLRRGGAPPHSAILIAVVEPLPETDASQLESSITGQVDEIDKKYCAELRIYDGRAARSTITTVGPNDVVASVPDDLLSKVLKYRGKYLSKVERGTIPVFFSRRFFSDDPAAERIEEEFRRALKENGCCAVEAVPGKGEQDVTFQEVSAWLWVAKAGLVVVTPPLDESSTRAISLNLAHEYGFLQGQGKPVRLLIDDRCADDPSLKEWSITHGVTVTYYSGLHAFEPGHRDSLFRKVAQWANWLKLYNTED